MKQQKVDYNYKILSYNKFVSLSVRYCIWGAASLLYGNYLVIRRLNKRKFNIISVIKVIEGSNNSLRNLT